MIAAAVLLVLAALLLVYIFWLKSFAWTAPRTRETFGVSTEQTEQTKPLTFNQGFYNLFLAIVVLVASDTSNARAAATQGTLPALALIGLALAA